MGASVNYTRQQFLADMRVLGMRQAEVASATGFAIQSVYQWGSTEVMPRWVPVLMAAWLDNKRLRDTIFIAHDK